MSSRRSPRKHSATPQDEDESKTAEKSTTTATKSTRSASPAKNPFRSRSRSPVKAQPTKLSRVRARTRTKTQTPVKDAATNTEPRPRGRPPKSDTSPVNTSSTSSKPPPTDVNAARSPSRRGRTPKVDDSVTTTIPTVLPRPPGPGISTDSPPKKEVSKSKGKIHTGAMEGAHEFLDDETASRGKGTSRSLAAVPSERKSRSPSREMSKSAVKDPGEGASVRATSRSKSPSKGRPVSRSRSRSPSKTKASSGSCRRSASPAKKKDASPKSQPGRSTSKASSGTETTPKPASGKPSPRSASAYEKKFSADDSYGRELRRIDQDAYRATTKGGPVAETRDGKVTKADGDRARRSGISRGELQRMLNERKKGTRPGDRGHDRRDGNDEHEGVEEEDQDDDDDEYEYREEDQDEDEDRPPPRGQKRSRGRSTSGSGGDGNGGGATKSRRTTSPRKDRPTSSGKEQAASPTKRRSESLKKHQASHRSPSVKHSAATTAKEIVREVTPGPKSKFGQTQPPGISGDGGKKPYTPGRGKVVSVTNPEFIPGMKTKTRNPFFETLPAPEVWHSRMPPYFTAGETAFMEQAISRQINSELQQGNEGAKGTEKGLGKENDKVKGQEKPRSSPGNGLLKSLISSAYNAIAGGSTTDKHVAKYPPKWDLPEITKDDVDHLVKQMQRQKSAKRRSEPTPSPDVEERAPRPAKRARLAKEDEFLMSGGLS